VVSFNFLVLFFLLVFMSGWIPVSGWWIGCLAIPGQWHSLAHKRGIHMCLLSIFIVFRSLIFGQSLSFLWRFEVPLRPDLWADFAAGAVPASDLIPPFARRATLLAAGGLNPSVEGANLLMICQVWLVDPMWGRGNVTQLAQKGKRTARLISRHG
jgi:hypothetical protein